MQFPPGKSRKHILLWVVQCKKPRDLSVIRKIVAVGKNYRKHVAEMAQIGAKYFNGSVHQKLSTSLHAGKDITQRLARFCMSCIFLEMTVVLQRDLHFCDSCFRQQQRWEIRLRGAKDACAVFEADQLLSSHGYLGLQPEHVVMKHGSFGLTIRSLLGKFHGADTVCAEVKDPFCFRKTSDRYTMRRLLDECWPYRMGTLS